MCSTPGISGDEEPVWQTTISDMQTDNEVSWTCVLPDTLRVKARKFVKNDTIVTNPIEKGIMFKYEFGYVLHFTEAVDSGSTTPIIKKIVSNTYNEANNQLIDTIEISST